MLRNSRGYQDVNIEAPATILKLVRANGSAVGKTIEDAIRGLAEAGGSASLRDARWVPDPQALIRRHLDLQHLS